MNLLRRVCGLIVYVLVDRCSPARNFDRQVRRAGLNAAFARGMARGEAQSFPAGKACGSVPCPSFEDATLEVVEVCVCHDLAPGQLYAPGCVVHDPAVIEA